MKKQKAKIDFTRVKDSDLREIARSIVNKMTSNPNFPNPAPALPLIQIDIDEYFDALVKCHDGTKLNTVIKNDKRSVLENKLAHLGNYVNSIAEGDLVKLDSSGFPLSKIPTPVGILPAPVSFKINEGENPGEIYFDITTVKKAKGYIVIYAKVPVPEKLEDWQSKTSSMSKGYMRGLESGKQYAFMVAATSNESNKTGLYNFTKPIKKFIQ